MRKALHPLLLACLQVFTAGHLTAQAGITIQVGNAAADDAPGIRTAITQAVAWLNGNPNSGPATVVLLSGADYHLDSASPAFPPFVLDIRDLRLGTGGLRFLGNGATLVNLAGPTKVVLGINNSHDVTVDGINFDLKELPYMDCVVQSVTDTGTVTIKRLQGTRIGSFPSDTTDKWGWLLDPQVPGRPKLGSGSTYRLVSAQSTTGMSDVFDCVIAPINGVPVNQDFAPNDRFIYLYRGAGSSIQVRGLSAGVPATGITVRGVRSYASVANVVNAQWVDGLTIIDCQAAIKPGAWQSTNGDGLHIKESRNVSIEGCAFAGVADDAINLSLVDQFRVRACSFTDKRRHAIFLDSDDGPVFLLANSTNGLIENNRASGNGGSFLVHRGGDYATVVIGGNGHMTNNLNRAENRCWQVYVSGVMSNGVARIVPQAGANGTWDNGDQAVAAVGASGTISLWDMQEVMDATDPFPGRLLFTNRALRDVNVWLYLAPATAAAGAAVSMQAPNAQQNAQSHYWLGEPVGNGLVRLRLEVAPLYLTRSTSGTLSVEPAIPGNPLQEWSITAGPGN